MLITVGAVDETLKLKKSNIKEDIIYASHSDIYFPCTQKRVTVLGFEPRFLRPQRRVLTTRRHRPPSMSYTLSALLTSSLFLKPPWPSRPKTIKSFIRLFHFYHRCYISQQKRCFNLNQFKSQSIQHGVLGIGIGIGIGDWDWGFGIGIWDWEFVIWIGDWF